MSEYEDLECESERPVKIVNMDTWDRKKLFEFYKSFDNPCFNITFKVDVQSVWTYCKSNEKSFFLTMLFIIVKSLNSVENFRYRTNGDNVVLLNNCNCVTPIAITDSLFQETELQYFESYDEFYEQGKRKIEQVKRSMIADAGNNDNCPYIISCVPWLDFESYTYASFSFHQDAPLLTFGKFNNGQIPITIKVNHCFVDGIHIKKFLDEIKNQQSSL